MIDTPMAHIAKSDSLSLGIHKLTMNPSKGSQIKYCKKCDIY